MKVVKVEDKQECPYWTLDHPRWTCDRVGGPTICHGPDHKDCPLSKGYRYNLSIIKDKKLLKQWGHTEPVIAIDCDNSSTLVPVSKAPWLEKLIEQNKRRKYA